MIEECFLFRTRQKYSIHSFQTRRFLHFAVPLNRQFFSQTRLPCRLRHASRTVAKLAKYAKASYRLKTMDAVFYDAVLFLSLSKTAEKPNSGDLQRLFVFIHLDDFHTQPIYSKSEILLSDICRSSKLFVLQNLKALELRNSPQKYSAFIVYGRSD